MFHNNKRSESLSPGALFAGLIFLLTFLTSSAWAASGDPLESLQAQVNSLQTQITDLQTTMAALQVENAALKDRVSVVENNSVLKLNGYLTLGNIISGHKKALFTGVNVQIVDGSGSTAGTTNGLGNLIVGYNETRPNGGDVRTGSHNIMSGIYNNYSSYGGLVIGFSNTISGQYSSVSGGAGNTASGNFSSVSGGDDNTAGGERASVSGGYLNAANGKHASVSGGQQNKADGFNASVSGGAHNTASGNLSSVSGGTGNTASGEHSSVSGGQSNKASGVRSSVSGGYNHEASNSYNWRAGDLFQND